MYSFTYLDFVLPSSFYVVSLKKNSRTKLFRPVFCWLNDLIRGCLKEFIFNTPILTIQVGYILTNQFVSFRKFFSFSAKVLEFVRNFC